MTAPMVIKGAMNERPLCLYRAVPGADTRRGDIVIMDNVPAHKVDGVREAIEAVGRDAVLSASLLSRSQPIELSFSALKAFLRKFAERTEDALCRRIRTLRAPTTARGLRHFFTHDGYAPT